MPRGGVKGPVVKGCDPVQKRRRPERNVVESPHLLLTNQRSMRETLPRCELFSLPSRLDGPDGLPRCKRTSESHLVRKQAQIEESSTHIHPTLAMRDLGFCGSETT